MKKITITISKLSKKRDIKKDLIYFENMLSDRVATYEDKNKMLAKKRKISTKRLFTTK